MASYLVTPKNGNRTPRGEDAVQKRLLEAGAVIKKIIDNLEDTSEDSTLWTLHLYEEAGTGVDPLDVAAMLRAIRSDLLNADREITKATEAFSRR